MYTRRLPLGVSLGRQQADFRIAARPVAHAVKPRRAFAVALDPHKGDGLKAEAPRLDKPQGFAGRTARQCSWWDSAFPLRPAPCFAHTATAGLRK